VRREYLDDGGSTNEINFPKASNSQPGYRYVYTRVEMCRRCDAMRSPSKRRFPVSFVVEEEEGRSVGS
jgi:hypothetical protein